MKNEESPLTVYKASAGGGKTFTLAVEYKAAGKESVLSPQHSGGDIHQQGYGGDEDANTQSAIWHLETVARLRFVYAENLQ